MFESHFLSNIFDKVTEGTFFLFAKHKLVVITFLNQPTLQTVKFSKHSIFAVKYCIMGSIVVYQFA